MLGPALKLKWLIYGHEVGESGTPHLQGAAVIGRQLAWATVKKAFPPRTHIEEMKGTPHDSYKYCTKEDEHYFQHGEAPKPGKRNDILNAIHNMRETQSMREFVKDDDNAAVYIRYTKGLQSFRSLLQQPRTPDRPPDVYWLHGDTGAGKTKHAWEFLEKQFGSTNQTWISNGSLRWFDGYDGHKGVILDDIRADSIPYNELLRLLDRYPLRVEFKGGTVEWVPECIIITAPLPPDQFFRVGDDIEQLKRRINKGIFEFTKRGPNPNLSEVATTRPNTPIFEQVYQSLSQVQSPDDVQELSQTELSLLSSGGRKRPRPDPGSDIDDSSEEEEETQLIKRRKFIDLSK